MSRRAFTSIEVGCFPANVPKPSPDSNRPPSWPQWQRKANRPWLRGEPSDEVGSDHWPSGSALTSAFHHGLAETNGIASELERPRPDASNSTTRSPRATSRSRTKSDRLRDKPARAAAIEAPGQARSSRPAKLANENATNHSPPARSSRASTAAIACRHRAPPPQPPATIGGAHESVSGRSNLCPSPQRDYELPLSPRSPQLLAQLARGSNR